MKHSTIARTLAVGAIATLALGLAPLKAEDKDEGKTCSAATIKGAYARRDTGFVIAPNAAPAPMAGVSLLTFDGNGTWTSSGFASVNGSQMQSTGRGTYTVNPDCTGQYEPDVPPPGRTGQAFFVIVDGGNEIQILPRDQGSAINCVARRVFTVSESKE